MLGKLMKHEFRATGRIMWMVYAAMVLLSGFANVSIRLLSRVENRVLTAIAILMIVIWVLALVIGSVMTVVLLIHRFYKNLLTDEGYLMFTLPGTVHHLVLSKLIVAVVWFMATMVMVILCVFLGMLDNSLLHNVGHFIREMFEWLTVRYALNGAAIFIEILVLAIVSTAVSCLQYYSAMAVGHGFVSHKVLWSVVFYFVMQFALLIISTIVMAVIGENFDVFYNISEGLSTMQGWHLSMLATTVVMLALGAIFYVITTVNLKKRLNLS